MTQYDSRQEIELMYRLQSEKAKEEYEKLFIGSEIKKLRRKAKMTQKELASKLKTSQSVIARMEAGKQNFTIQTLIKIASFLGKKIHIRIA